MFLNHDKQKTSQIQFQYNIVYCVSRCDNIYARKRFYMGMGNNGRLEHCLGITFKTIVLAIINSSMLFDVIFALQNNTILSGLRLVMYLFTTKKCQYKIDY